MFLVLLKSIRRGFMNRNEINVGVVEGKYFFLCMEEPFVKNILKEDETLTIDMKCKVLWKNHKDELVYAPFDSLKNTRNNLTDKSLSGSVFSITWKNVPNDFFQKFFSFAFPDCKTKPIVGVLASDSEKNQNFIKDKILILLESLNDDSAIEIESDLRPNGI